MWSVRDILESRSIAVIGASRDPQKPGAQLLDVLSKVGFQGRVAGVNPQGGEVSGRLLYPSLAEVPFPVDLAVFLIPPPSIPAALVECARKGVKGVVISSEGFAETGPRGARYQEEVRSILKSTGMRGFGPNTLGLVNTATRLTTSYYADSRMLQPGSVGIVAQSGIFMGALLRYLSSLEGLQISKGIGLGNKVDVDESEALEYLLEDEQTRMIGVYLEDVRNGRRFLETAKRAAARKPVLVLKGGRTAEGARAAASHTASLVVPHNLFAAALRQAGVLPMTGISDFISCLKGFAHAPLPRGPRIALVTYSGAQAIMSIDSAVEKGLKLARFNEATIQKISQVITTASKAKNPVDIFPDTQIHGFAKTAREILQALLADGGVDGIIFMTFADFAMNPLESILEMALRRFRKPVFFSLLGGHKDFTEGQDLLEKNGIPCFDFPEAAIMVFANMWKYARMLNELHK